MTEPLRPASNKAFGRENWIFVPAVAGYGTGVITAAEVNAASALDITRIAFADGAPAPTQNTEVVEQQRRVGDTTVAQFIGMTTYAGGVMDYQMDPQAAAGSDGKKLYEKIKNSPGTVAGYLVRRLGVGRAVTPAIGQFVDAYQVEFGPSLPGKKGDGSNSETSASTTFAITDPNPLLNVALT